MAVIAGLVMIATAGVASACPNCKDAVPGTDAIQASSFGTGLNLSIYAMFGGLALCGGMVGRAMYKGAKSAAVVRVPESIEPRRDR